MKKIASIAGFLLQLSLGSETINAHSRFLGTFSSANVKDPKNTHDSPLFAALECFEADNLDVEICTNETARPISNALNSSFDNYGKSHVQYGIMQNSFDEDPAPVIHAVKTIYICSCGMQYGNCDYSYYHNRCASHSNQWNIRRDNWYYVAFAAEEHSLKTGRFYLHRDRTDKKISWESLNKEDVIIDNACSTLNRSVSLSSMDILIYENINSYVKNDKLKVDMLFWILNNTPKQSNQFNQIRDSNALLRIMKLPFPQDVLVKLVHILLNKFKCDPLRETDYVNAIHVAVKKDNTEIAKTLYESLTALYGRSLERNRLIQKMGGFLVENKIPKDNKAFKLLQSLRKEPSKNFGEDSTCDQLYETLLSWNSDFADVAQKLYESQINGRLFLDSEHGFTNARLQNEYGMESDELIEQLNQHIELNNKISEFGDAETFLKTLCQNRKYQDSVADILDIYEDVQDLEHCTYEELSEDVPALFRNKKNGKPLCESPYPYTRTFMKNLHMKLYGDTNRLCEQNVYGHDFGVEQCRNLSLAGNKESNHETKNYNNNTSQSSSSASRALASKEFNSNQHGGSAGFTICNIGPSVSYSKSKSSGRQNQESTKSSRSSYRNNESNHEERYHNQKSLQTECVSTTRSCQNPGCSKTMVRGTIYGDNGLMYTPWKYLD